MAFDPISAIFSLVETGVDKFLPDKMSEKEKADVKFQMTSYIKDQALIQDKNFRDFILKYEGAAKDIPEGLVWLRSSIRPVITYVSFGLYGWGWVHPEAFTVEQMTLLKPIVLICLSFWFTERVVNRTGLVDVLTSKRKKSAELEDG